MADTYDSAETIVVLNHIEDGEEIVSEEVVEDESCENDNVDVVEMEQVPQQQVEVELEVDDEASGNGEVGMSTSYEGPGYVVNTIDVATTSDSSSTAEPEHDQKPAAKKLKSVYSRKERKSKAKTRKRAEESKKKPSRKQIISSGKDKKKAGKAIRQSLKAQMKKEKIRKANMYLRKGLDSPTSAPNIANIPEKERLKRGLEDLASGKYTTVSSAAAYWRVHAGKLYRRQRGDIPWNAGHGPAPVLTTEEEEDLANWILIMSQRGFQVPPSLVRDAVQSFFKRDSSPFINGRPSYRWYYSFLRRNTKLQGMKTSKLSLLCEANPSKAVIDEWFLELKSFLMKLGIVDKPGLILNYAETALELNKTTERVTVVSSPLQQEKIKLKKDVTVGVCAAADGRLLPPFIIYRGLKHMPLQLEPLDGAPQGSETFLLDKEGAMQGAFSYWLSHCFIKKIGKQHPVVLLLSHQSQISYEAYITARQNNVYLFRVPPKVAPLVQPLDIGEDVPFRSAWITQWVMENKTVPVTFRNVADVIRCAWTNAENTEAIRSCFIQSGIHPFDRDMVDDHHLEKGNLKFLNEVSQHIDKSYPEQHDYSNASSNSAEVVFKKLDEKLDKTTRETYRSCVKSGLHLDETPLFSVWKKLYMEAHSSNTSPRTTRGSKRSKHSNKKQSSRGKKNTKDTVYCPVCDERYGKDGEDWIGCDGPCHFWYHINCLPPEVVTPALLEDKEMVCPECLASRQT